LKLLRREAKEQGFSYLHALRLLAKAPNETVGFGAYQDDNAPERLFKEYIEKYRTKYYEKLADSLLFDSLLSKVSDADALKEKVEKYTKGLGMGRKIGAERNKARAEAVKELAKQINQDLLKHLETARWGLEKRATYIAQQLEGRTITVGNKPMNATMKKDKPYKADTITNWIKGS
jgi:hypothetical protein